MDYIAQYARGCGKLPSRYWYQLNGNSAHENWIEQRQSILEGFADPEDDEQAAFYFESEVNTRWPTSKRNAERKRESPQ